jgi:hypothetical protein
VKVDPVKPKLEPPGTKRLKLNFDTLLSTSAFKFNLRRYIKLVKINTENYPKIASSYKVEAGPACLVCLFGHIVPVLQLQRERRMRTGRRMRRVCTGEPSHHGQTVRGRVARSGRTIRRVCKGTLAHYEHTVRERVARPQRRRRCECTGALGAHARSGNRWPSPAVAAASAAAISVTTPSADTPCPATAAAVFVAVSVVLGRP